MSASKKREAEAPANGGKAAGKRRIDSEPEAELDDSALDILLSEDPQGEGLLMPSAESLDDLDVTGVLPAPDGEDEDEDEDGPADAADESGFEEIGELPDGLEEAKVTDPEEVDLSAHELTLPEARRVAQALAENESLTTVKFSDHSLAVGDLREEDELEWDSEEYTDVDAIIIAELLKTNETVKRLDLARNNIGDAGACALAEVLKTNTVVEYVNLESNMLGERAGLAFRAALDGNTTLQYLNLMYNSVPTGLQADIRETWQSSRQSQQVGLHL